MGLTKHLHISNWVSLDWRLCENGGNSKPLIFFTSWSISAGHRVWNAAEHFETGSVFCVQNMTGTSHLKGLLSPGRLLTWRFTRERLVLIQYKYWVLHNTCNIITLIFIKDKQSLASKNTCVYICSSERASVRFMPRSRRISMLHGCIWIIFRALRRVQIYIKRWKCIPPREACDKKPYWNSMREIFLFFSFFPCEDQKWVMGLWESISQTIVFLMPRILTAPIIQSKVKRTLYPWDGGGWKCLVKTVPHVDPPEGNGDGGSKMSVFLAFWTAIWMELYLSAPPYLWCIAEAKGRELMCRTLTASLSCFSNETPMPPSPRSALKHTLLVGPRAFFSPKRSTCRDPVKVRHRLPMISSLKSGQLASGRVWRIPKGVDSGKGENTCLNIDKRSGDYRRRARCFICNRNTARQSYSSERYTAVIIYKTPCHSV